MEKVDWIALQLLPEETAAEAASRLNTKTLVPNPVPQGTIPLKATVPELVSLVSTEERYAVTETQTYQLAREAFISGNMADMIAYFNILVGAGKLSGESAAAVSSRLTETVPDPSWSSEVYLSLTELAGYAPVFVWEVELAMNLE